MIKMAKKFYDKIIRPIVEPIWIGMEMLLPEGYGKYVFYVLMVLLAGVGLYCLVV